MPRREGRAAMPTYHCLFLDSADRVAMVKSMECTDDSVAQIRVGGLLAQRSFDAVEIREAGRQVHRVQKPRPSYHDLAARGSRTQC